MSRWRRRTWAIEAEIAAGATWIKIIGDFPVVDGDRLRPGTSRRTYGREVVAAAVETAHRLGARVAFHTNTAVVPDLVAAGVDSVEHGLALTEADVDRLDGGPDLRRRRGVLRMESSGRT